MFLLEICALKQVNERAVSSCLNTFPLFLHMLLCNCIAYSISVLSVLWFPLVLLSQYQLKLKVMDIQCITEENVQVWDLHRSKLYDKKSKSKHPFHTMNRYLQNFVGVFSPLILFQYYPIYLPNYLSKIYNLNLHGIIDVPANPFLTYKLILTGKKEST